jgi:hypothetical protein
MGYLKSVPNVFGLRKAIDPIKLIFFPMRIGALMKIKRRNQFVEVAQNPILHPHPEIQLMYAQ